MEMVKKYHNDTKRISGMSQVALCKELPIKKQEGVLNQRIEPRNKTDSFL